MQIAITGFGPFNDVTENPSGMLAQELERHPPAGCLVTATVLPVTFAGVPGAIESFILELANPVALLSIGVHPGAGFRLERHARAAPTSKTAGTDGVLGLDFQADRARETSLDLEAIQSEVTALAEGACGGVSISEDAGGYVCDWTYQHLLQHAERLGIPGLFLHVPPLSIATIEQQMPFVRALVAGLADC